MVKFCNFCGLEIHIPDTVFCAYCQKTYCLEHRLVEDHNCKTAKKSKGSKKQTAKISVVANWMYNCLDIAKGFINKHHRDQSLFFSEVSLNLFILDEDVKAYGRIKGAYPRFRIGIHPCLSCQTLENSRMVIIVLVHQLLHAVHPNWTHSRITAEEKNIANLAGYFDSLRNMKVLYLDNNMQLCNK